MRYANIERSPRLQRTLLVLQRGGWFSTRDLIRQADICAVNSCIAELRCNGYDIASENRNGRWYYRLEQQEVAA